MLGANPALANFRTDVTHLYTFSRPSFQLYLPAAPLRKLDTLSLMPFRLFFCCSTNAVKRAHSDDDDTPDTNVVSVCHANSLLKLMMNSASTEHKDNRTKGTGQRRFKGTTTTRRSYISHILHCNTPRNYPTRHTPSTCGSQTSATSNVHQAPTLHTRSLSGPLRAVRRQRQPRRDWT